MITPDQVTGPDGKVVEPDETDFNPEAKPREFVEPTPSGPGYSWAELQAMSTQMSKSRLLPEVYRNHPENVMVMAIMAQELGWGLTTAMRFVHVIEGKPTVSPEGMLALVRRAGHHVTGEADARTASVRGVRADNGDEMWCRFTMADAVTAGIANKDNWKKYPDAMLWARALGMLCRRLFSDVLLGAAYTPDEMGAVTDENGNPIFVDASTLKGEKGPQWERLGWADEAAFMQARAETKTILDALPPETRAELRRVLGPAPDFANYNLGIWTNRHHAVVAAARKLGLVDDTDHLIVRVDAPAEPVAADEDQEPSPELVQAAEDAADAEWVAQALGVAPEPEPEVPEVGLFDEGGYG